MPPAFPGRAVRRSNEPAARARGPGPGGARFRSLLPRARDAAGVPRPGGPAVQRTGGRDASSGTVGAEPAKPAEPLEPSRPLEELLAELDGLVGLAAVKAEVKLVTNLLRI